MKTLVIGSMALGLAVAAGMSHAGMFAEMFIGASAIMERHAKPSAPSTPAVPALAIEGAPATDATGRSAAMPAADGGLSGCTSTAAESCNAKSDARAKAE